ncbi:hypothetical protein ACFQ9R_08000 [Nocardia sp. NPDC056541]
MSLNKPLLTRWSPPWSVSAARAPGDWITLLMVVSAKAAFADS